MAELLTLEQESIRQPEHWVDAARHMLEAERDFIIHELDNPNERNGHGIPRANAVKLEWETYLSAFSDLIKGVATREEAIAKIDAELAQPFMPERGALLQLLRGKLDVPHDVQIVSPAKRRAA